MQTLLEYEKPATTLFNLDHNLEEYNRLVTEKYNDGVPVTLDAYETAPRPNNVVTFRPELEQYVSRVKPAFNPIVADRYDLIIEEKQPEPAPVAMRSVRDEVETEEVAENVEQFQTSFKLNAVGMVTVVSFIAVTVMIIAFIIANGITISSNAMKISTLQTANTTLSSQLAQVTAENQLFYQSYQEYVLANASVENLTFTEYLETLGYAPVTATPVAPVIALTPQANLDHSTNLFDTICAFLSKIF